MGLWAAVIVYFQSLFLWISPSRFQVSSTLICLQILFKLSNEQSANKRESLGLNLLQKLRLSHMIARNDNGAMAQQKH